MASIAIKVCRGGGTVLRIRVGNEGGEWGVQARGCLRLIVLIRIQRPSTKRISCKSQRAQHLEQHAALERAEEGGELAREAHAHQLGLRQQVGGRTEGVAEVDPHHAAGSLLHLLDTGGGE